MTFALHWVISVIVLGRSTERFFLQFVISFVHSRSASYLKLCDEVNLCRGKWRLATDLVLTAKEEGRKRDEDGEDGEVQRTAWDEKLNMKWMDDVSEKEKYQWGDERTRDIVNGERKGMLRRRGVYEWGKRTNSLWMEPTDKPHLARCIVFTYPAPAMVASGLKLKADSPYCGYAKMYSVNVKGCLLRS